MKKILALILCLAMFSCFFIPASASFDRSYVALKGTPNVDGTAEAIWDNAAWTEIDKPHDGADSSNCVIRAKLLWDEDNLYFLADIYDPELNADIDTFEIYLDENNEKAYGYNMDDSQTRFLLTGVVVTGSKAGQNAKTESEFKVVSAGEGKYIMEGKLPWTMDNAAVGAVMGLEFMYNEGKEGATKFTEAYRWNANTAGGDTPPYLGTVAFGTLVLASATGSTDAEAPGSSEITTDAGDGTTAPATTEATEKENNSDLVVIIGVAAAVVVIAAVVIIVIKKKK